MGGPKTKTTQQTTQANTYDYKTPKDTPDTSTLRDLNLTETDPGIGYTYGAAKQRIGESFNNPYGAYTTPAIREATERSAYGDLAQQEGAATQEAAFQNRGLDLARKQALAGMTAPTLVQTGGSFNGTGTQQQTGGVLNQIIGGVASAGSAALSNPTLM